MWSAKPNGRPHNGLTRPPPIVMLKLADRRRAGLVKHPFGQVYGARYLAPAAGSPIRLLPDRRPLRQRELRAGVDPLLEGGNHAHAVSDEKLAGRGNARELGRAMMRARYLETRRRRRLADAGTSTGRR